MPETFQCLWKENFTVQVQYYSSPVQSLQLSAIETGVLSTKALLVVKSGGLSGKVLLAVETGVLSTRVLLTLKIVGVLSSKLLPEQMPIT